AYKHISRLFIIGKLDQKKIENIIVKYSSIYGNVNYDENEYMKVEVLYACHFYNILVAELQKENIANYIKNNALMNGCEKTVEGVTTQYLTMCKRLNLLPNYKELAYFISLVHDTLASKAETLLNTKYDKSEIINKLPAYLYEKYRVPNGTPLQKESGDIIDNFKKEMESKTPTDDDVNEEIEKILHPKSSIEMDIDQPAQYDIDPNGDSDPSSDEIKEVLESMSKEELLNLILKNPEEGEDNE
ncbi:hypothetical protein V6O07_05080, partial [Arthrospira platensis SPKY2]